MKLCFHMFHNTCPHNLTIGIFKMKMFYLPLRMRSALSVIPTREGIMLSVNCRALHKRNCTQHKLSHLAPKVDSRLARQAHSVRSVDYKYILQREKYDFSLFSLHTHTQALTPPPPPPTTIDGHHEPPLLAPELPHQEERFNRSRILKINFKYLVENNPSILSFVAFLR